MKIRKQIYDLTLADLNDFPIWEFCHDEEGEENQDECTVRPFKAGQCNLESMFICHAVFTLANGKRFEGFVSPAEDLSEAQPTIYVSDSEGVSFWFGGIKPEKDKIEKSFHLLGGRDSDIFPIEWKIPYLRESIPQTGIIKGFFYLENFENLREIT